MPGGSRASVSESALLVRMQSHALSPQSGHLFHNWLFVLWVSVGVSSEGGSSFCVPLVGVDRYGVGARGRGCFGVIRGPCGSRVSDSESSLLVSVHSHALSPQSGHLFHDLFLVFVFLRERFHTLLAVAEWSFGSCCFLSWAWRCGEGFLVSECIGHGPLLSSSTGRVGVVGDFGGGCGLVACGLSAVGR